MQKRRTRPDPVSCESCRSKKLKCNRVQPCSNCATRDLTCSFRAPSQKRAQQSSAPSNNIDILSKRIDRLEALILSGNTSNTTPKTSRSAPEPVIAEATASGLDQGPDQDLQALENIGTGDISAFLTLLKDPAFMISGIHDILETQGRAETPDPASEVIAFSDRPVAFPPFRSASLLFDNYETNVDHVCRILHNPTVQSRMQTFHLSISQQEPVAPAEAALFLSILALSSFFYPPSPSSETSITERDAVGLSRYWSTCALEVLHQSQQRTLSWTLEHVQTHILLSFVTYHLDGFSARGRYMSTAAISGARELRLHRLDTEAGSIDESRLSPRDMIDREVKRRVVWHLTATDWLHATISGPQEGMYFIQPNQVSVRLPLDCNDNEISFGQSPEAIGVTRPTSMTFYLARVRLAHICRQMADTIPLETSALMRIPYDHIMVLDQKLEDFLCDLPFYLRLDNESRARSRVLETVFPKIPIMRYCIAAAAHSRRCRLHHRFLLRISSDPRCGYSRRACLASARAVVQCYHDAGGGPDAPSPTTATARMAMAVHYTHLALVIMVMDLCFNKTEADHGQRRAEVKEALGMLEAARHVSPLVERSLNALHEVLRKHGIELGSQATSLCRDGGADIEIRRTTIPPPRSQLVWIDGLELSRANSSRRGAVLRHNVVSEASFPPWGPVHHPCSPSIAGVGNRTRTDPSSSARSKHVLNAQVSIRSPCCRKWFDCAECHHENETHALRPTLEMTFACKKCRKCFRKEVEQFEEADEYCPHCDNHFVLEAVVPKPALRVEGEDARVDNRMLKDDRAREHRDELRTVFDIDKDADRLG
ncbi:hypothetical protein JX266_012045 [Neoarthrinium moseri]|nr:hypothetical protein JX266_012045 [Neoarthrinium moseri]